MRKIQNFVLATSLVAGLVAAPTTQAQASINKPSAPIVVSIKSSRAKNGLFNVTVKISVPKENGGSKIIGSKITADGKSCLTVNLKTSCTIKGIANGKTFKVKASSKNKKGFGTASASVEYTAGHSAYTILRPFVPHPVQGGYGITWQNIVQRVNDISAAAWTDAQTTLVMNKDLPNAGKGLETYISPNAAKFDAKLGEVNEILNRTFTLFAKVPASSKIFFVATTYEDAVETKAALKGIYSDSKLMNGGIDSIYGLDQNPLAGTPFVYKGCGNNDYARNGFTWPNTRKAQVLTLGVCPAGQKGVGPDGHFEAVQGMSHEYVHLIQIGLRPNTVDTWDNIPCWMVEGEAEWAQTAVATDFSNYLKGQHFHPYLLTSDGRQFEQTTSREWTAEEVQSYYLAAAKTKTCHNINQYAYSYSLGAATIEALASIGGSESWFALHERLIIGETMNQAFSSVYGITWAEASPILAQVVAKKISMSWSKTALTYQTRPAS
jgi:hypothetical protein